MGLDAAADLARRPPTLVILQHYLETDIHHLRPLDFTKKRAWKPVYDYVLAHYTKVDSTPDADVYVLS